MENMNVVDLAAIAIILVSTILAYFRGLSREILAIVSWVIAALMGFIIAPYLDPFINKIPIIKEILMDSCELSIMISYIVGFLLSLIFLSLLIPILTNIIHQSNLNGLDKLLGLCFGASRGLLIIIVLTIVYDLFFIDNKSLPQVESSQTNKLSAEIKKEVKELIPNSKPKWMIKRFNLLMTVCEKTNTKILKIKAKEYDDPKLFIWIIIWVGACSAFWYHISSSSFYLSMPPAGRLISNPAAALGTGTIPGMAGWNENPGGMSVWRRALLTILLPTIEESVPSR